MVLNPVNHHPSSKTEDPFVVHLTETLAPVIANTISQFCKHAEKTKPFPLKNMTPEKVAKEIVKKVAHWKLNNKSDLHLRKNLLIPFTIQISAYENKTTHLTIYFPDRMVINDHIVVKGGHSFVIPSNSKEEGYDYPSLIKRVSCLTKEDMESVANFQKAEDSQQFYGKRPSSICIQYPPKMERDGKVDIISQRYKSSLQDIGKTRCLFLNPYEEPVKDTIHWMSLFDFILMAFKSVSSAHYSGYLIKTIHPNNILYSADKNGDIKATLRPSGVLEEIGAPLTDRVEPLLDERYNHFNSPKYYFTIHDTYDILMAALETLLPNASNKHSNIELCIKHIQMLIQTSEHAQKLYNSSAIEKCISSKDVGTFQQYAFDNISSLKGLSYEDEHALLRLAVILDTSLSTCRWIESRMQTCMDFHLKTIAIAEEHRQKRANVKEAMDNCLESSKYISEIIAFEFKDLRDLIQMDMSKAKFRAELRKMESARAKEGPSSLFQTLTANLHETITQWLLAYVSNDTINVKKSSEYLINCLECTATQQGSIYLRFPKKETHLDLTFVIEKNPDSTIWIQLYCPKPYPKLGEGVTVTARLGHSIHISPTGKVLDVYSSAVKKARYYKDQTDVGFPISFKNNILEELAKQNRFVKKILAQKPEALSQFNISSHAHVYWSNKKGCLGVALEEKWCTTFLDIIKNGGLSLNPPPRQSIKGLEFKNIVDVTPLLTNQKAEKLLSINSTEFFNIFLDRLKWLEFIHTELKVALGDIKPNNLYLTAKQIGKEVSFSPTFGDFGLLSDIGQVLTTSGGDDYQYWDLFARLHGMIVPTGDLTGYLQSLYQMLVIGRFPNAQSPFDLSNYLNEELKTFSSIVGMESLRDLKIDDNLMADEKNLTEMVLSTFKGVCKNFEKDWQPAIIDIASDLLLTIALHRFIYEKKDAIDKCYENVKNDCLKHKVTFTWNNIQDFYNKHSQLLTAKLLYEELTALQKDIKSSCQIALS